MFCHSRPGTGPRPGPHLPARLGSGRRLVLGVCVAIAAAAGCKEPVADPGTAAAVHVPAKGTVAVDGKPLKGAVMTFFHESGIIGAAETKDDGSFAVSHLGTPGLPPNAYKVTISYKVKPDGNPLRLQEQSGLVLPEAAYQAKEQLAPEYSDLGRSRLAATIPREGKTDLRFDLPGPLPQPNSKASEKTPEPKSETDTGKGP